MADLIEQAADELRELVISNGYEEVLIHEVADEFGVSPIAVLNRFKIKFGKHPSEIQQVSRKPRHVSLMHVLDEIRSYPLLITEEDRLMAGSRFYYKGEPHLLLRHDKTMSVTWAYRLKDGQKVFFEDPLWKQEILPQIKMNSKG